MSETISDGGSFQTFQRRIFHDSRITIFFPVPLASAWDQLACQTTECTEIDGLITARSSSFPYEKSTEIHKFDLDQ